MKEPLIFSRTLPDPNLQHQRGTREVPRTASKTPLLPTALKYLLHTLLIKIKLQKELIPSLVHLGFHIT